MHTPGKVKVVEILAVQPIVIHSTPLMNVVSVISCLRNYHQKSVVKLWEEFSFIFPHLPAWALKKLVNGDYDTTADTIKILVDDEEEDEDYDG